jgi:hypothetical protein
LTYRPSSFQRLNDAIGPSAMPSLASLAVASKSDKRNQNLKLLKVILIFTSLHQNIAMRFSTTNDYRVPA